MQRRGQVQFNGKALLLPCFFPSVSTVKTNLAPSQYIQILQALGFPQFLVSAYDYVNSEDSERDAFLENLTRAKENGSTVLLDSGNYESFWERDPNWTAGCFRDACRSLGPNLAFCFDDQSPPLDRDGAAEAAISRLDADLLALPGQCVLPIVHGHSSILPHIVGTVCRRVKPKMVAVAERELGDGITERCRTVAEIRKRLDEFESYCPLHLLGTGNPFSILAFVLSGADSFDGLEWCQTVADFSTGQLSHFQHWDLYASSSPVGSASGIPYPQRTLAHNLVFWADFMKGVREFVERGTPSVLVEGILRKVRPILPVEIP